MKSSTRCGRPGRQRSRTRRAPARRTLSLIGQDMRRPNKTHKSGFAAALSADRLGGGLALTLLALTAAAIVADQIHQLPPRAPTQVERSSATPGANTKWQTVYGRLAQRLTYGPPELGAVWASRSGRICGVVTRLDAGVYFREPFYTEQLTPLFASDDEYRFVHSWLDCVGDHWVDLQVASDEIGLCAVPRNLRLVTAAAMCTRKPLHAGFNRG